MRHIIQWQLDYYYIIIPLYIKNLLFQFVAVLCLFGLARASGWHGSGLGYSSGYTSGLGYASGLGYGSGYGLGYSGYVAPAYSAPIVKTVVAAPIVTKAVVPAISYAPAISTVSRYQVHSSPIVKSYVSPVSYASYASPYTVPYGGLGYSSHGYGGYGSAYGSKYLW